MSDEPAPPVPVPAGGYVQRNREHRRRRKFRLQGAGKIATRGGGQFNDSGERNTRRTRSTGKNSNRSSSCASCVLSCASCALFPICCAKPSFIDGGVTC